MNLCIRVNSVAILHSLGISRWLVAISQLCALTLLVQYITQMFFFLFFFLLQADHFHEGHTDVVHVVGEEKKPHGITSACF